MTVKELKKLLSTEDDMTEIVMSRDEEGNGFSPLADVGKGIYVAESTWAGELYNEDDEEAPLSEGKKVICLWPTN